jgi:hypothetical protein
MLKTCGWRYKLIDALREGYWGTVSMPFFEFGA